MPTPSNTNPDDLDTAADFGLPCTHDEVDVDTCTLCGAEVDCAACGAFAGEDCNMDCTCENCVNAPCEKCGRTDLPLHTNYQCAECGPTEA